MAFDSGEHEEGDIPSFGDELRMHPPQHRGRRRRNGPYALRFLSASSIGAIRSIGTGNTMVEALSPAMLLKVCR